MRDARQVDQRIGIDARTVAPVKRVAIGLLIRPQIELEIEPIGAEKLITRQDEPDLRDRPRCPGTAIP